MNNKIKLYPHNKEGYTKVKDAFNSGERVVGIVHATGTGKTYISLELLLDNPSMKSLFVVPSNAIIEHIKETIEECGLSLERDFSNLEFCTYQSLTTKTDEELASLDLDMLVLDEFHHIGAPVWGEKVDTIVNTHPNMKVFGMTAYTVRDRGTPYERDMALPGGNELFSDKIVSIYDIYDAMCDGVLPIPNYKSAHLNLLGEAKELEECVLNNNKISKEDRDLYLKIIKSCKEQIDKAPKAKDLIKKNLQNKDKCIYFCPVNDSIIVEDDEILGTNDVQNIRRRIGLLALEVSDYTILYETTSDMGDSGLLNRSHFYNDTSFFRNEDVSNILRIMFAKNQYNEGVHAPGVTKVFLGRQTKSDIVFFEQIGRALSVKGNIIELTKEYENKTIDELISLANSQSIDISRCNSKEEIIERLLAPTIVDLVGNIEFIKELKDNLKARIKERQEKGIPTKITRELVDVAFDITVENEDIYQILQELHDKIYSFLTPEQVVDEIYALYEQNGKMPNKNCEEPLSNGTQIGNWIKRNKDKIIALAEKGNAKAKKIVEELKLEATKIKIVLSPEQAVDEIYALYEQTEKMPNTRCLESLSNGTKIGNWIFIHKDKIIALANQGNAKAKKIVEELKLEATTKKIVLSPEQVVDEIYALYEKTGKMPNTVCQKTLSNGTQIKNFIIYGKDVIIALANQGNVKAKKIVEELKMDQEKIVITLEQAVDEIYAIYEKTEIMPNTQSQELLSNGTQIGSWIYRHKDDIIALAEQGNTKAKKIVEELKLELKKIKIVLSPEQVVDEIYAKYEVPDETGNRKMPNTQSQERLSNGAIIGNWISVKRNQEKIIALANQGNEKAKKIVEDLKLDEGKIKIVLTIEQALDEIYAIYEKTEIMPNTQSQELLSNGTQIGSWIKRNKDEIISLANQGNAKAKKIVEELKLELKKIRIVLTIEQALNEIYALYEQTGKLPNTQSQELLSNGAKIGIWLIKKRKEIISLANQGNVKAQIILESLDNKNNKSNIEQLCNEYSINYQKNKKNVDKLSARIFNALLKYFSDNNIPYVDSDGLLISDFYMSSKDFESKYGISIIELLHNNKTK